MTPLVPRPPLLPQKYPHDKTTSNDITTSIYQQLLCLILVCYLTDPSTAPTTAAWITSIAVSPSSPAGTSNAAVGVAPDAVDICVYGLGSCGGSSSSNHGSSGVSIVFVMRPTLKATLKNTEGYAAMSSRII